MRILRRLFLIAFLFCSTIAFATTDTTNQTSFNIDFLYIKPSSNNLKYATFVSGMQPYYQSWHYLQINPTFHPAFELGLNYAIIPNTFLIAVKRSIGHT